MVEAVVGGGGMRIVVMHLQKAQRTPLQTVLDSRGYLVMTTDEVLQRGDVVEVAEMDAKFAVLSETDRKDFEAQAASWGHTAWKRPAGQPQPNYYRVTAE